ncbi:MAG: hypothetical protein ACJAYC_003547 [Halieaceae bacterium]|jgi:hypothetical protein
MLKNSGISSAASGWYVCSNQDKEQHRANSAESMAKDSRQHALFGAMRYENDKCSQASEPGKGINVTHGIHSYVAVSGVVVAVSIAVTVPIGFSGL